MMFTDDLFENHFNSSRITALEICHLGCSLPFEPNTKKLLFTFFARKKDSLFNELWEDDLQMNDLQIDFQDLYNGSLLKILDSHKKLFKLFEEKKIDLIEYLKYL